MEERPLWSNSLEDTSRRYTRFTSKLRWNYDRNSAKALNEGSRRRRELRTIEFKRLGGSNRSIQRRTANDRTVDRIPIKSTHTPSLCFARTPTLTITANFTERNIIGHKSFR